MVAWMHESDRGRQTAKAERAERSAERSKVKTNKA
jgi:hypothetical protein